MTIAAGDSRGAAWDHDLMDEDRLVKIYASGDAVDAQLMQGRLESEGIPVLLKGESEGPYRTGPAYLWTPAEHEPEARRIIEAVRSGAFALAEDTDVGAEDDATPDPPR